MKIQKYLLKFVNLSMSKSHFQNVAALWRCGCFSGNFLQYLRAALPSESYASTRLLWIELYTVISFHYCTDLFLCSKEQRDYCSIFLYSGTQKLFKIDHLKSLKILPTGDYAAHLCFLKIVKFQKKFAQNFVKLWAKKRRRGYCEAVRNAVKLSDTCWNCDS